MTKCLSVRPFVHRSRVCTDVEVEWLRRPARLDGATHTYVYVLQLLVGLSAHRFHSGLERKKNAPDVQNRILVVLYAGSERSATYVACNEDGWLDGGVVVTFLLYR